MVSKKSIRKTCPVCPTDNVADLPDGVAKTGFQGRKLGESVQIWKRMLADPECTIFFGLSGCTFHEAISWGKESAGTI
jgi:deoxyhypusine synthase